MKSYSIGVCLALIGALSLAAELSYAANLAEFDEVGQSNTLRVAAPIAPKAPRIAQSPYRRPAQAGLNTGMPMGYRPVSPAPPPPMYRPITKCKPAPTACFQPPCPPPVMPPMQVAGPAPCGPQAMCGPPPCQMELYPTVPRPCMEWY